MMIEIHISLYDIISTFLLRNKLTLCCHSRCLSVHPSVRPLSVEISLESGCTITNRPIDLKFGLNIDFFEIRIAGCKFMQFKFFFVFTVLTNLLTQFR